MEEENNHIFFSKKQQMLSARSFVLVQDKCDMLFCVDRIVCQSKSKTDQRDET
jgi:hypothetical protein